MDRFKNVSLAERVITIWKERQAEAWSPAMTARANSWVTEHAIGCAVLTICTSLPVRHGLRISGVVVRAIFGVVAPSFTRDFD